MREKRSRSCPCHLMKRYKRFTAAKYRMPRRWLEFWHIRANCLPAGFINRTKKAYVKERKQRKYVAVIKMTMARKAECVYLISFLAGIVLANTLGVEELRHYGILNEYFVKQLLYASINYDDLLFYVAENRGLFFFCFFCSGSQESVSKRFCISGVEWIFIRSCDGVCDRQFRDWRDTGVVCTAVSTLPVLHSALSNPIRT